MAPPSPLSFLLSLTFKCSDPSRVKSQGGAGRALRASAFPKHCFLSLAAVQGWLFLSWVFGRLSGDPPSSTTPAVTDMGGALSSFFLAISIQQLDLLHLQKKLSLWESQRPSRQPPGASPLKIHLSISGYPGPPYSLLKHPSSLPEAVWVSFLGPST